MAADAALSPSQVRRDGRWTPIRHNTVPSIRSHPPHSINPCQPSLRALRAGRSLTPIQERRASSVATHSSGSLDSLIPTYQPTSWKSSAEQLVFIEESPQLQQMRSVSLGLVEESWRGGARRLYRTQSQWALPAPVSYVPSGIPRFGSSLALEVQYTNESDDATPPGYDEGDSSESEDDDASASQYRPRGAMAELSQRAERYDQEHPEILKDSGKVWVRVNSVSHGLSKTFKTMGSLHKKRTSFEARLGPNVPVYSRLRCYEKPSRVERVKIVAHDAWRKFRNWSTGRDTELATGQFETATAHPMLKVEVMARELTAPRNVGPRVVQRRLSRATRLERGDMVYRGHARKDSKNDTYEEPVKRRRSSLFLDIYSTDGSAAG